MPVKLDRRPSNKPTIHLSRGCETVSQRANTSRGNQASGSGIGPTAVNDTLSIRAYPQSALAPAEGVSSLDLAAGSLCGLFFARQEVCALNLIAGGPSTRVGVSPHGGWLNALIPGRAGCSGLR